MYVKYQRNIDSDVCVHSVDIYIYIYIHIYIYVCVCVCVCVHTFATPTPTPQSNETPLLHNHRLLSYWSVHTNITINISLVFYIHLLDLFLLSKFAL